jgi:hypothetical protein
MVSRSDSIYFRIFGEKCSNFVQKAAQFFEKLKIVRKRRSQITLIARATVQFSRGVKEENVTTKESLVVQK